LTEKAGITGLAITKETAMDHNLSESDETELERLGKSIQGLAKNRKDITQTAIKDIPQELGRQRSSIGRTKGRVELETREENSSEALLSSLVVILQRLRFIDRPMSLSQLERQKDNNQPLTIGLSQTIKTTDERLIRLVNKEFGFRLSRKQEATVLFV
jgi:hypothetical protein